MSEEGADAVTRRSHRRRRTWAAIVALGVLALLWLLVLVLVVPVDDAPTGDAVIVHAGGRGERIDAALSLMDRGAAPTLVVMYLGTDLYPDTTGLCEQEVPYEVICPAPDPVTTIGEAQAIGELEDAEGWDRIVIVTTDYHVRRAKHLDGKCADAAVLAAAGGHRLGFWAHLERVGHEMLGLLQAFAFRC
ncbi:MAG TPA: YdcF family protein [Acidimicrobiia bacterium]|nr:YdcF family protein [Acidimicrobiia bacterium]